MARKSLRPHLNQIRSWVRQGRTDAWVAHQLEVPVQDITQFKQQNELLGEEEPRSGGAEFPEEVDLRAEDDALIAAELEAAAIEAEREKEPPKRREGEGREGEGGEEEGEDSGREEGEGREGLRRGGRRGRGRGRGLRRAQPSPRPSWRAPSQVRRRAGRHWKEPLTTAKRGTACGSIPRSRTTPIYAEHWAGHRPVEITIEEEQIVIRRISEES